MTFAASRFRTALPIWISRPLGWLFNAIGFLFRFVLLGWATLALYFSNLPWPVLRQVLAVVFLAFGIWALWLTRRPRMGWAFAAAFLGVAVWWRSILPSHDRPWRPEVAVMPRAFFDGDRVRITGVRNFEFRTRHDFTERWEEREVSFSHLVGLDFCLSFWREGAVGHTFESAKTWTVRDGQLDMHRADGERALWANAVAR